MKVLIAALVTLGFLIAIYLMFKDFWLSILSKKDKNSKSRDTILLLMIAIGFTSCATVDAGHKGVEVSWGGETNMQVIHNEGMASGFHWLFDDMIQYDCRERTLVEKFEFNDKVSMLTNVEIALDFALEPTQVNQLHVKVKDYEIKIQKTLKSAAKEVIPQYTAVELNLEKRNEAEHKLAEILSKELPEFYVLFARVQITDVDIPPTISNLAEETAKQLERNKLAEKKEAEKIALAKAQVAEAEGNYQAAIFDAKRKEVMSQPKMLELYKLETERIQAEGYKEHGKSWFGENNIFGSETSIIKGLK
jgi:regulator of protease activity HflC (stomatin/prohibitin superfamily)